jgi:ATP-binding cassette subfamily B (MDR/TAP) protein 8
MSFAARFAGRPSLGARPLPRRSRPVASSSRVHAPRGRAGSSDKTTRAVADESRHRARAHLASGAFARPVRAPPRPFATRRAVSKTAEHAEPGASADPPVPSRSPPGGDDDDDHPGASLQSRDDDDARDPSPPAAAAGAINDGLAAALPPPSTASSALDRRLRLLPVAWAVARRRPLLLLAAFVSMAVSTAAVLLSPVLSSRCIECLIGARAASGFPALVAGLIALYALESVCTFAYSRCVSSFGEDAVRTLREALFESLLAQKVAFHDQNDAGALAATLTVEVGLVRSLVAQNAGRDRGFRALCECVGTVVALFFVARPLAPALAFAVVSFAAVTARFNRSSGPTFAADAEATGALSASAATTFSSIRVVRSFAGEIDAAVAFERDAEKAREAGLAVGRAKANLEVANRGCIYLSLLTLYAWGGYLVSSGALPVGALIASVGYTFGLIFATQGVVNTAADFKAAGSALRRVRELCTSQEPDEAQLRVLRERDVAREDDARAAEERLDSAADKDVSSDVSSDEGSGRRGFGTVAASSGDAVRALLSSEGGDVRLENVSFAYPSRPNDLVLRDCSLTIPRGKTLALVGSSGAGKSTVAQLLCRFYEPAEGRVAVGNRSAEDVCDASEWLDAVALVEQTPTLFAGSVEENIAYGRRRRGGSGGQSGQTRRSERANKSGGEECSDERVHRVHRVNRVHPPPSPDVVRAAKAANAHAFVESLADGYATDVGAGGGRLSGGQRQRVAIARAVLKDAPVLILDEATSALDAASEAETQRALEALMRGRTTLVIAHRLSTVQRADAIAVMERGRVVQCGTHEELLRDETGRYYQLVNSQRLVFA